MWRDNKQVQCVLDLSQPANVVLDKLHDFFRGKPKNG
jgi:hypothetical protein